MSEPGHPVCPKNVSVLKVEVRQVESTDVVDTMIVGRIRSGMTSKKKRDKSQAVGLVSRRQLCQRRE